MEKIKSKISSNQLVLLFALLLALFPFLQSQWIVGTLVNFLLIFATMTLGIRYSFPLCFIPSISALFCGLLPFSMFPMVAFIILGNLLLIFIFQKIQFLQPMLSVIIASCMKFLFLFTSFSLLSFYFSEMKMFFAMMSFLQLTTALLGGTFAIIIRKRAAN